jgi:sec-independent protein translocase protein TatC
MADVRRRRRLDPNAMTLAGHLAELRRRLLIAVAAVALMAIVAWMLYGHIVSFLLHPFCAAFPKKCANPLYVQNPLDGLSFRFRISVFGGLGLASPIVLWEVWRFITPGLRAKEKRYAIPFVVSSIVLFALGCFLAYWSFEHALVFLTNVGGPKLTPIYGPNQYAGLLVLVMFLYGATFIFPVLLVFLELAGVVSSATLLRHWRPAIFGITLAAAIFTPTADPVSMVFLMIPLSIFYLGAAGVGRLLGK